MKLLTSPLFRRLFVPQLLLIGAVTAAVGLFAAARMRAAHLQRTRVALARHAILAGQQLPWSDPAALPQAASRIGAATEARVTLVAEDGTVLADNEADPDFMENHRSRPEIMLARHHGEGTSIRPSETIGEDLLYVARKISSDGNTYYIRLAVHLTALRADLRALYATLAGVALSAVVVAGLICFVLARRSAAPFLELTDFADAMARGEIARRVPRRDGGELGVLGAALNSMADSLTRLIRQTEKDRAELRAVLASMREAVVVADAERRVVLVNDAAKPLLAPLGDIQPGDSIWQAVRDESILKMVGEVQRTGEPSEALLGPLDGRYIQVCVCPLATPNAPPGLILVAHDATQTVKYDQMRKEFVANVSHELRTPLSVIKGFAETLRDGALDDPAKARQYLTTIERHADQLANLVNDLLDLSRLESQTVGFARDSAVDLGAVVRRAVEMLRLAAQAKGQQLEVRIDPALPSVTGNAAYLERAVTNLVDNAIKYTPEQGRIDVSAELDDDQAVICVSDNGIGIPPEDLPRIFERFYRVDRSRSREMGGTGLGLSIVKHIAQAHGGSVEANSTPGNGSRFIFRIPLHHAAAAT